MIISINPHKDDGTKVTPNQLAKELIANALARSWYVLEGYDATANAMTDKEEEAFMDALDRRLDGVFKYLSIDEWGGKS